MTVPSIKEALEALATDEAMGVTFDEHGQSFLPNGQSAVNCTACAERFITLALKRGYSRLGMVVGWAEGDNPASIVAGPAHGARLDRGQGHDFAIIGGRYVVDPWAKNVEGTTDRAVFDLHEAEDLKEVHRLYGDWTILELMSAAVATDGGEVRWIAAR